VALPVLGNRAKRLVRTATQIQDLLGERQDAVVARALLRHYRAEPGLEADVVAALDGLDAVEDQHVLEHEVEFIRFWNSGPLASGRRRLED